MKVCIFGGSFNPIHYGHVNSALSVQRKYKFDKFIILPNFKTPLKESEREDVTPQNRFQMAKLAFQEHKDFEISNYEIDKKDISYTIHSLCFFAKKYAPAELYFLIGSDNLYNLHLWKDCEQLFEKAHFISTSRLGHSLDLTQHFNQGPLSKFVSSFGNNEIKLSSGKKIFLLELKDVDASSTQVRKALWRGQPINNLIPSQVIEYIQTKNLYKPFSGSKVDFEKLTRFCSQALFDRKAINVRGFNVQEITQPADFNLISSGTSKRHTQTLAEHVIREVRSQFSLRPHGSDGKEEGNWIVLDYGGLILHIFYEHTREEYNLEELWAKGVDMHLLDEPHKT